MIKISAYGDLNFWSFKILRQFLIDWALIRYSIAENIVLGNVMNRFMQICKMCENKRK